MKEIAPTTRGRIAVVIATCDRPTLLARRALRSVFSQEQQPDRVVLIDDSNSERNAEINRRYVRKYYPKVEYLRNRRTDGLSGALNSGIDHLARYEKDHSGVFVAVLDDDDSWHPDHLKECLKSARKNSSNMVASGLIRITDETRSGHKHSIPTALDPEELFIRGQYIQGSNVFVSLELLLLAGMFDEHLPSCTDRDLCIRLARQPSLRFSYTTSHTVEHFAESRSDRLSTPGSQQKLIGLKRFWRKHASSFDKNTRREAEERAFSLFGWKPTAKPLRRSVFPAEKFSDGRMSFIVGFITDSDPKKHVNGLLNDLKVLSSDSQVEKLKVVVLENGPRHKDKPSRLHKLVSSHQSKGLEIQLVSLEQQESDWRSEILPDSREPYSSRRPIAVTRTILNTYLVRAAEKAPDAAIWILDDDKRLKVRVRTADSHKYVASPNIGGLIELKRRGVDVVIGPDTDAAPLPFVATLRVQLIDLEKFVSSLTTDSGLDRADFDCGVGIEPALNDSHYDLSRTTEHLETPRPIHRSPIKDDPHSIISEFADNADRMLAGEAIFRPLSVDPKDFGTNTLQDSVQRGGSTIFFNANALAIYPQTVSRIGDLFLRRSDMLVTLFMRELMGMRIVSHPFAGVSHDRTYTKPQRLCDETLRQDVLGYALYRSVEDILASRNKHGNGQNLLLFSEEELETGRHLIHKYTEERLAALRLNAFRVNGLCDAILKQINLLLGTHTICRDDETSNSLIRLRGKIEAIRDEFDTGNANRFISKIQNALTDEDAVGALRSMDGIIHEYQTITGVAETDSERISEEREANARRLLKEGFNSSELSLLGLGGEGVIFTNGDIVYKVFDLLKHRPKHNIYEILAEFRKRVRKAKFTYQIRDMLVVDGTMIITYPYEQSSAYHGGCGADLIGMLRELKAAGFVFRNMHPDNLRVTSDGLKLIDFGSDIRPYSDAGYRSMAERAWLTFLWAQRDDLRLLMRSALNDKRIPEMEGFERFWETLNSDAPSATRTVNDVVMSILGGSDINSLLDYGCGKKAWTIKSLADFGVRCVGYDPNGNLKKQWEAVEPVDATLTTSRELALKQGPYDAVVSSLVLCELPNGEEYEQVLSDIHGAMTDDGLAIITVCNPHSTFGQPTPLHRKRKIPGGKKYSECFWYTEFGESGRPRQEFHRPLHRIEGDLLRHGLVVQDRIESKTVDIERFEPASDFMTLVCRKAEIPADYPSVSLLIKACGMEATTIERQVRHLVRQLEGPRMFCEKVLVLDTLPDNFIRQHSRSDMEELERSAERLRNHGIIDRIIRGPSDLHEVSNLMLKWFDMDTPATHSKHGAPLAAPLRAFKACSGEYILQVDSDLLIHRSEPRKDYLGDMISLIENSPQALTASLSVAQRESSHYEKGKDAPWRVEVRGCLLHRKRLLNARPYPNRLEDEKPVLSWHRSLDESVKSGGFESLRGKCDHTWFIHPENELKLCTKEWMLMLDLVEKGHVSSAQYENVNLLGGPLSWVPKNRNEDYIFLVTGRNVPPERMARCLESITRQKNTDWGAVIIDDASERRITESLKQLVDPYRDRITLIQPRERRGQMANMILGIRHTCTNPESTIITLDLDDCLIGNQVLDRLAKEYDKGADVTVGSMLRTDKQVEYPVDFTDPRTSRGGNVWQHLRSFKRRLFERIPDHYLRVENAYVDIAVDWSFMLPIIEMAERPIWIQEQLYLYEPSGMGKDAYKSDREHQISQIVAKPGARVLRSVLEKPLLEPGEITQHIWEDEGGILFVRHAERPSLRGLAEDQKHMVELTEEGIKKARALGLSLKGNFHVASSPMTRTMQTAHLIAEGAELDQTTILETRDLLSFICSDEAIYRATKTRLGWKELMLAWMDGALRPGLLHSCHEVSIRAIKVITDRWNGPEERVVAVTHDFMIMAILASLKGLQTTGIPYLSGLFLTHSEINHWLNTTRDNEQ